MIFGGFYLVDNKGKNNDSRGGFAFKYCKLCLNIFVTKKFLESTYSHILFTLNLFVCCNKVERVVLSGLVLLV